MAKYTIEPIKIDIFELNLEAGTPVPTRFTQSPPTTDFDAGDVTNYIVLPAHSLQALPEEMSSLRVPTEEELRELQPQQFFKDVLSGNLLGSDSSLSLAQIANKPVSEYEDKVILKDPTHNGQLVIYLANTEGHHVGDFIYQCADGNQSQMDKSFHYALANDEGQLAHFALNLEFGAQGPVLANSDYLSIDEEALIPGANEASMVTGVFGVANTSATFAELTAQTALIDLELTSANIPLYYQLSDDHKILTATQGANGIPVFEVILNDNGEYDFNLMANIDRAAPDNLLDDNMIHFESLFKKKWPNEGWHIEEHGSDTPGDHFYSISQQISTEPGHPYQLQFFYHPPIAQADDHPVQLWWNGDMVFEMPINANNKGYSFSLDATEEQTELMFVTSANDNNASAVINQIAAFDMHQQHLPLPFQINQFNELGESFSHEFAVNVTTTPPLLLSSANPMTVVYDQSVYQSIVVPENNASDSRNTLSLQSLFDNMAIAQEDRVVSVVQQEKNGEATNIYEVQISHKNDELDPITVADVKLSFPGGDGGLEVFYKNIAIDEGS